MRVHAAPNTDMLSLTHAFFEATPTAEYRRAALQAFEVLRSLNYLASNANTPGDLFGLVYVPVGERGCRYLEVFNELVERGFLERYSIRKFPETAHYGVRPEYIDWGSGSYVFDWGSLTPRKPEAKLHDTSIRPQADRIDVLLLKELEFDATRSFPEISAQLKERHGFIVSDRLFLYHVSRTPGCKETVFKVPRRLLSG
ncbi:MAG: hypothetical protein QW688_02755 [Thermoprotei archaeon]